MRVVVAFGGRSLAAAPWNVGMVMPDSGEVRAEPASRSARTTSEVIAVTVRVRIA
ncbi:hypothetical protein [Streptomyces sp. NPDC058086]|uniref:hypothetical protein n=1 Tax=Streptomyces sp. NPDC058086 TaxID=3346334 RepID=UPI0036EB9DC4